MNNSFHKNLRELRLSHDWYQIDIAEKLHVTRSAVSNWEKDRCPDYDMLIKLARILDTSVDYLIGNVDEFGNLIPCADESL